MLPQIIPLPWVMIFFMLFIALLMVGLYLGQFFVRSETVGGLVSKTVRELPW